MPLNSRRLATELRDGLKEAGFFVLLAIRALKFWRKDPPVLTVDDLARFAETRAKYAAQTALFGYVKTRVGTRYAALFADEVFAKSLNIAKWEIYLAALSDNAVYVSASAAKRAGADANDAQALAIHILNKTLDREEIPKERPQGFDDIRTAFSARARTISWDECAAGETAFHTSLSALVHWAPIADELKILDEEIVKNSMRFKWKKVRDDFDELLNVDAVMADWHSSVLASVPSHSGE